MDDLPAMLTPPISRACCAVNPKTVTRWASEGRLSAIRTPGGHRRFPIAAVLAFLEEMGFSEDAAVNAVRALA